MRKFGAAFLAAALMSVQQPSIAQETIKIGNTQPYSGPASAFGTIGKTISAYFNKVNSEGGINGRKLEWISYDDAYSPPKTVEQTRRLIEQDKVDVLFQQSGTTQNTAIVKYVNSRKVPHLFIASAASKWNDPKQYPWTTGWAPSYYTEASVYAKHILENVKDPKVAVLYQNDDFGKDYLNGLKKGLGDRVDVLVAEAPYAVSDATVENTVTSLKASGANVFVILATPKFAAQAIKRSAEIGWDAQRYITNVSISVGGVLTPAGLEASKGLISADYLKQPGDPQWKDADDMVAWRNFMTKWYPDGDQNSSLNVLGYAVASIMVQTLKNCGNDFSRENIMKQAEALSDVAVPMLLPGITVTTSPTDHAPLEAVQFIRFNGESWDRFGDVVQGQRE